MAFIKRAFLLFVIGIQSFFLEAISIEPSINTLIPEKPLVVVITSYNNAQWFAKNLESVLTQNYKNYRVIYIDDGSPDGTAQLVDGYIKEHKEEHRFLLIKNSQNIGQMANHYKAVCYCADDEIVVHLDGDDFLIDKNVLKVVNTIYSTHDAWLTYGQASLWPLLEEVWPATEVDVKIEEAIASNKFRKEWMYGHLRTFKAALFKQIKLQDLIHKNSFKTMSPAPDVAFMYPMLEMAGTHGYYVKTPLYLWNRSNPNSQHNLNLAAVFDLLYTIQAWEPYQRLVTLKPSFNSSKNQLKADVFLFAHEITSGNPALASLKLKANDLGKITLFYDKAKPQQIVDMKKKHPKVALIPFADKSLKTFQTCLLNTPSDHLILMKDNVSLKNSTDMKKAICSLETTFAQGFYFDIDGAYLEARSFSYVEPFDHLIGWQPETNPLNANDLNMIMYRKRDIQQQVALMHGQQKPFSYFVLPFQPRQLLVGWKNSPIKVVKTEVNNNRKAVKSKTPNKKIEKPKNKKKMVESKLPGKKIEKNKSDNKDAVKNKAAKKKAAKNKSDNKKLKRGNR